MALGSKLQAHALWLELTCSIGFALFPVDRRAPVITPWMDIVAMADRAAYAAKRAGRNRCVAAESTPPGRAELVAEVG